MATRKFTGRSFARCCSLNELPFKHDKLAQEIRKRLPINVILHYQQSWNVGFGLPYFARDKGRIVFDSRKIDKKPNRYSWSSEYVNNLDAINP